MAGLREQHKATTRRALEDAALRLFTEHGYDGTSVDAIAAEAGVSPRTFFRYFAAKDEVLDMGWPLRQAELVSLAADLDDDLDDDAAVARLLRSMSGDFAAERDRLALRAGAVSRSPLLRGRTTDALIAWESTLAGVLASRHGRETATLHDHVTAARAVATWTTAIGFWLLGAPDDDLLDVLDAAFGLRP